MHQCHHPGTILEAETAGQCIQGTILAPSWRLVCVEAWSISITNLSNEKRVFETVCFVLVPYMFHALVAYRMKGAAGR